MSRIAICVAFLLFLLFVSIVPVLTQVEPPAKQIPDEISRAYNVTNATLEIRAKDINAAALTLGRPDEESFVPDLTITKWGKQVSFSLLPNLTSADKSLAALSFDKEKIIYDTTSVTYKMYELPPDSQNEDGGYEYEITLKSKPDTNQVSIPLATDSLDFFYQPPLTEELKPGDKDGRIAFVNDTAATDKDGNVIVYRPDNVVGSYAAYYTGGVSGDYSSMGGKNYRTGKAFQIYRPQIKDFAGNTIWGELKIDASALTITIPQDFLDKAVYPVVVDPTFGYTGTPSSSASSSNMMVCGLYTAPTDYGTTTSITVSIYNSNNVNFKGVIVNSTLYIITNGVSNPTTAGSGNDVNMTFPDQPSISPNTDYYLCGIANDTSNIRWDSAAGYTRVYDTSNSYNTPQDPVGTAPSASARMGVYVTYTPAVPSWTHNSTNTTVAGQPVTFSVFWNSVDNLSSYQFFWNNGSNVTASLSTYNMVSAVKNFNASKQSNIWLRGQLTTNNTEIASGWVDADHIYTRNGITANSTTIGADNKFGGIAAGRVPANNSENVTLINSINITLLARTNTTVAGKSANVTILVTDGSVTSSLATRSSYVNIPTGTTLTNRSARVNDSWGITWTADTANNMMIYVNLTNISSATQARVDTLFVDMFYNLSNRERNTSWVTYSNFTGINTTGDYTSASVTINVTSYVSTGSTDRGNTNPSIYLQAFNGTNFLNVTDFNITAPGNYTLDIVDPTILAAWTTQTSRQIRIMGIFLDANSAADQINYSGIVVNVNTTSFFDNDSAANFDNSCHQEDINLSTNCGGIINTTAKIIGAYWESPENISDNDWSTGSTAAAYTWYWFRYEIPDKANHITSYLHIKDDSGDKNVSVPEGCWGYAYEGEIEFKLIGNPGEVDWQCTNQTVEQQTLSAGTPTGIAYDYEMVWIISNNWSNVTKTLNSTVGANITWYIWANDTSGNQNVTPNFTFLTTSAGGGQTYSCIGSDILSMTEPATMTWTGSRTASELASMAEAELAPKTTAWVSGEIVTLSDSNGRTLSAIRLAPETMSFVEAATRVLSGTRTVADIMNFGEGILSPATRERDVSDLINVQDSNGRVFSGTRQVGEVVTFTDSSGRAYAGIRMSADVFVLTDTSGSTFTGTRTNSDILTVRDSNGRTYTGRPSVSDVLVPSETSMRSASFSRSVSDFIAFVEAAMIQQLGSGAQTYSKVVSDVITMTEAVDRHLSGSRSASDFITLTDTSGRTLQATRISSDTYLFTDSSGRTIRVTRLGPDTIQFTDISGRTFTATRLSAESIAALENSNPFRIVLRAVSESIIVNEVSQRTARFTQAVSEIISMVWDVIASGGVVLLPPGGGGGTGGGIPTETFDIYPHSSAGGSADQQEHIIFVRSLTPIPQEISATVRPGLDGVLVAKPQKIALGSYETGNLSLIFVGIDGFAYEGNVALKSSLGQEINFSFRTEKIVSLEQQVPPGSTGSLIFLMSQGKWFASIQFFFDQAFAQPILVGLQGPIADIPKAVLLVIPAAALFIKRKKLKKRHILAVAIISSAALFLIPSPAGEPSIMSVRLSMLEPGSGSFPDNNIGIVTYLLDSGYWMEAGSLFLRGSLLEPVATGLAGPVSAIPKFAVFLPLAGLLWVAVWKKKVLGRYALLMSFALLIVMLAVPSPAPTHNLDEYRAAVESASAAAPSEFAPGNIGTFLKWLDRGELWQATKVFFGSALAQPIAGGMHGPIEEIPKALIFIAGGSILAFASWKNKIKWRYSTALIAVLLFVLFVIPPAAAPQAMQVVSFSS